MSSYRQRASIRPYLSCLDSCLSDFLAGGDDPCQTGGDGKSGKHSLVGVRAENNHLKDGVVLQSCAGLRDIQGNRRSWSSGVINQNPVVIREVKVTGKVFNIAGKELERQTIWIGNTISPKIIRGMTAEDIPHLQDLKPLKSFELPPGDSIPFTVVFLKPAKQAKDFSLEVVLADGAV
jgi:hypothetical protein